MLSLHRPQQEIDWSLLRHVLCGLILLGRLGDIISTRLITPKLELEANPLMRRLGWKFAVLTVLLCLAPYVMHPALAVILVPPFLMISGSNIGKIWVVRALGEKHVLQQSIEAARNSTFAKAATCAMFSGGFFILTGLVLVYLVRLQESRTQASLLPEYFGFGVAAFGLAISLHGTLHLRRIFRLAAAPDAGEAQGRAKMQH
jgi:hypothetical protein